MTRIRFLQNVVVQDELRGTSKETRFAEGEIADLAPASADHWLNRGKAELAPEVPAQPKGKKAAK